MEGLWGAFLSARYETTPIRSAGRALVPMRLGDLSLVLTPFAPLAIKPLDPFHGRESYDSTRGLFGLAGRYTPVPGVMSRHHAVELRLKGWYFGRVACGYSLSD